jgi:hypothetical protein
MRACPHRIASRPHDHALRQVRSVRRRRSPSDEHRPCFHLAAAQRALPSGVRGPVLEPPCIRHRPLGIAGDRQGAPERVFVFAPQRGALSGFPGGLPYKSHPRPGNRPVWGPAVILRPSPSGHVAPFPGGPLPSQSRPRWPVLRPIRACAARSRSACRHGGCDRVPAFRFDRW